MRSSTTRILILSLSIVIAAIVGLQLHWLQKTYAFETNEFSTSAIKSIRGLYEDIDMATDPGGRFNTMISRPNADSYIFRVDNIPNRDSLSYYLMNEFDDFNVYTDCRIAVYDHKSGKYTYTAYLAAAGSSGKDSLNVNLPVYKNDFSYVLLNFPDRNNYILNQMNAWILTSALVLLLLTCFAFSIYYFFKQKFFNEIQKDFINNITHEFSTPLTVIELSTEALERPSVLSQPDKVAKYTKSISNQAEYLKKHIQTLMKTVVADNHTFALDKTSVVPNTLIRQAVSQLEPIVIEKKGAFVLQLEQGDVAIQADYDNLYLAFFNIINNALKYSPEPKILIETHANTNHYYIVVKDNGIGIEQDDIKKIFKKFYRAQKGNLHNVKGLGLGLYFTKKVIDLHKGSISVQSIPDVGTEFKIEVPLNNPVYGS